MEQDVIEKDVKRWTIKLSILMGFLILLLCVIAYAFKSKVEQKTAIVGQTYLMSKPYDKANPFEKDTVFVLERKGGWVRYSKACYSYSGVSSLQIIEAKEESEFMNLCNPYKK